MRSVIIITSLLVTLLLLTSSLFVSAATFPEGKFCGSYLGGLASGTTHFESTNRFTLKVTAFDKHIVCEHIKYELDQATGAMKLPDAANPDTCLGKVLQDNKLSAKMTFNAGSNKLDLNVGVADLTLRQC